MTSSPDESRSPTMVDREALATAVTLASDALAEALEALGEAAKAMSEAGLIAKYDESTRVLQGIVSLLRSTGLVREGAGDVTPSTPENISLPLPLGYKFPQANSRNEGEANHKAREDSADQHVGVGHRAQSRSEQLSFCTSPSMPSISLDATEVESALLHAPPADQIAGSHSSQPGPRGNWTEIHDTPEPEHDNEPNLFHEHTFPSNVKYGRFATGPAAEGAIASTQPYANILGNIYKVMETYPQIPAGRNYIQLDQASDALAFVAYMTLQAYRTILLVPDLLSTTFSELLKSLTRANVHRITTVHEFQRIATAFRDILVSNSYDVLVISSDLLNFVSLHDLYSDCVLHWGQPPNANLCTSPTHRQAVYSSINA
ncbi:hypothetical protein B0J17DRAFT_681945 [Rhizoctonia solani]|nr:hypothetical protein B0J17DRAFT_681945 [Rhizoctonia solani]